MVRDTESLFVGSLLGLALGDALGAPFEGGILERAMWCVIGKTADKRMRWTDDTQMSLDIAESLLACGRLDQDDVAKRFSRGYRWSRGYGPGAARVLKLIRAGVDWQTANTRVFPEGSFGNGGAMRAPVIGLFCVNAPKKLAELARASAVVTHAHPVAQDSAMIVARATALALGDDTRLELVAKLVSEAQTEKLRQRLEIATTWLERDASFHDVRVHLGSNVLAESCVTAVYIAMRFIDRGFLEMLEFVKKCGGDVDTIGAMAGAVWGARNGVSNLPERELDRLEVPNTFVRQRSDFTS